MFSPFLNVLKMRSVTVPSAYLFPHVLCCNIQTHHVSIHTFVDTSFKILFCS